MLLREEEPRFGELVWQEYLLSEAPTCARTLPSWKRSFLGSPRRSIACCDSMSPSITTCATWMFLGQYSRAMDCALVVRAAGRIPGTCCAGHPLHRQRSSYAAYALAAAKIGNPSAPRMLDVAPVTMSEPPSPC